ncbi:coiled-coil domain-containing protein 74A-like [Xenentodon cancila]
MSRSGFPPSRYLPHWSRVGRLGKPSSAGRAPGNQPQQRLPAVPGTDRGVGTRAAEVEHRGAEQRGADQGGAEQRGADQRVASLQRNIQFLQQQYQLTLEKLHAEIDYLRRENKELKYKLIMKASDSSRKGLTNSRRTCKGTIRGNEARPSLYLEPLQDSQPLGSRDQKFGITVRSFAEGSEVLGSARLDHGRDAKGHLVTSLDPLQIQSSPSHPPRAPTLQECQVIIHQLSNANRSQSQEILRMKTVLRDIVLSKKITPQNDILAKRYLINGNGSGPSQCGVVLPALKQSVSSGVPDGQRTVSKLRQRGACNALRNHLHK